MSSLKVVDDNHIPEPNACRHSVTHCLLTSEMPLFENRSFSNIDRGKKVETVATTQE
jgi:hypothetical protein